MLDNCSAATLEKAQNFFKEITFAVNGALEELFARWELLLRSADVESRTVLHWCATNAVGGCQRTLEVLTQVGEC